MSWLAPVEGAGEEPVQGEIEATTCPVCNCVALTVVREGLAATTEGAVACTERLEAGIKVGEGVTVLFPWGLLMLPFRRFHIRNRFMLTEHR